MTPSSSPGRMTVRPNARNWTQIAAQLGYDTKATNISFRIKEWLKLHHIDSFFDYLMGIPNDFTSMVPPALAPAKPKPVKLPSSYQLATAPEAISSALQSLKRPLENDAVNNSPPLRKIGFNIAAAVKEELSPIYAPGSFTEPQPLVISSPQPTILVEGSPDTDENDVDALKRRIFELEEENSQYYLSGQNQQRKIDSLTVELDRKTQQVQHASKFKELIFRYSDLLP